MRDWLRLLLLACFSIALSCSKSPSPIILGKDSCAVCHMIISEPGFGGEIVSKTGKVTKYDSIGCLLTHYRERESDIGQTYVVDTVDLKSLVEASQAKFLKSEKIRGPMASDLLASSNDQILIGLQKKYGGEILSWGQVVGMRP